MKLSSLPKFDRFKRFLWGASLFLLPVTSFRYLPLGGGTQVKPLSLIPLGLLFILLLIESLERRRFLMQNSALSLLLAFALLASISTAAGFLLAPPDLYDYTYESRILRAWVTFSVGLMFFLVPSALNHSEQDFRFTLKWLYAGVALHAGWSVLQLIEYYFLEPYLDDLPAFANIVDVIQRRVMMGGLAPNRRISGMTLEPSWLAAQMASTYLPWCFAAWMSGYFWSARRKIAGILVICLLLTLLTFSRSGILIVSLAGLLTFLLTGQAQLRAVWQWFWRPFKEFSRPRRSPTLALRVLMVLLLAGGLPGILFILNKHPYFAALWQTRATSVEEYFVKIYAGPRLALGIAGWRVFEQHPWTGVGLGAAGFYLHKQLPDWSHFNIPEIASFLSSSNTVFPNIKNLYIRLLAETGIFGFWLFIAFYLFLMGKSLVLTHSSRKFERFVGIGGLFACLAIAGLGFSLDSLANPMIWLAPGIFIGLADSLSASD